MNLFVSRRAGEEIARLAKKASTKNIKLDICAFFHSLGTMENIRNVDETLGPKGRNTSCKKSRLKNSINNEKNGGFRVYFIVSEQYDTIIIASIYSKKMIQNFSKEEIKRVFKSANEDLKEGKLRMFTFCKESKGV
jgi:hypothetical protein